MVSGLPKVLHTEWTAPSSYSKAVPLAVSLTDTISKSLVSNTYTNIAEIFSLKTISTLTNFSTLSDSTMALISIVAAMDFVEKSGLSIQW